MAQVIFVVRCFSSADNPRTFPFAQDSLDATSQHLAHLQVVIQRRSGVARHLGHVSTSQTMLCFSNKTVSLTYKVYRVRFFELSSAQVIVERRGAGVHSVLVLSWAW